MIYITARARSLVIFPVTLPPRSPGRLCAGLSFCRRADRGCAARTGACGLCSRCSAGRRCRCAGRCVRLRTVISRANLTNKGLADSASSCDLIVRPFDPLGVVQQHQYRAPPVGIGALTSNVRSDAWPMFRNKSVVDRTSPRFAPDRSGVQIIADDLVDGRGVEFPARLPDHAVRVELLGDPVV